MHAPFVAIDEHPLLDAGLVVLELPSSPGGFHTPDVWRALLHHGAAAPLRADDHVRAAVRDLLRHDGFKPTGRNKPSSEYLLRASEAGTLQPIHAVVDLGNAVSLHSGLPISIVDLDRALPPLRITIAPPDARYVFNASGQDIAVADLLCLSDAKGPCANAVKDAQRTKVDANSRHVLAVVWGTRTLAGRTGATLEWLLGLARAGGLTTSPGAPGPA
ncbi:MAG: hypothetical protein HZB39_11555 [Planctomycetes bacterium]|nr:hypothetical protein [Planctomycetota bacterium]